MRFLSYRTQILDRWGLNYIGNRQTGAVWCRESSLGNIHSRIASLLNSGTISSYDDFGLEIEFSNAGKPVVVEDALREVFDALEVAYELREESDTDAFSDGGSRYYLKLSTLKNNRIILAWYLAIMFIRMEDCISLAKPGVSFLSTMGLFYKEASEEYDEDDEFDERLCRQEYNLDIARAAALWKMFLDEGILPDSREALHRHGCAAAISRYGNGEQYALLVSTIDDLRYNIWQ